LCRDTVPGIGLFHVNRIWRPTDRSPNGIIGRPTSEGGQRDQALCFVVGSYPVSSVFLASVRRSGPDGSRSSNAGSCLLVVGIIASTTRCRTPSAWAKAHPTCCTVSGRRFHAGGFVPLRLSFYHPDVGIARENPCPVVRGPWLVIRGSGDCFAGRNDKIESA